MILLNPCMKPDFIPLKVIDGSPTSGLSHVCHDHDYVKVEVRKFLV